MPDLSPERRPDTSPILAAIKRMRGIPGSGSPSREETRDEGMPKFPGPYSGEGTLARLALSRNYRLWWERTLPSPYGYCACGCARPTLTAKEDDPERGLVAREKMPFLDSHATLYGHRSLPGVSDPERRCACGCGAVTREAPLTLRTKDGEMRDGRVTEFKGMRRERISRHKPTDRVSRLDDPLGSPNRTVGPLHSGYLAAVLEHRGTFGVSFEVRCVREHAVRLFARLVHRGRVSTSSLPSGKTYYRFKVESLLERANVLFCLYPYLTASARREAAWVLQRGGFPVPDSPEFSESISHREEVERGYILGTIAVRGYTNKQGGAATVRMKGLTEEASSRLAASWPEASFNRIRGSGKPRGGLNTQDVTEERYEARLPLRELPVRSSRPTEIARLIKEHRDLLGG